jgi:hypothetical protein
MNNRRTVQCTEQKNGNCTIFILISTTVHYPMENPGFKTAKSTQKKKLFFLLSLFSELVLRSKKCPAAQLGHERAPSTKKGIFMGLSVGSKRREKKGR